ncbi:cold-shock protein [Rhodococcus rhodochrous]|uniref:cold-shock protein n=1 Tax=Rhodococcus aetherivorans TaxID=191292 RepID=UPI0009CF4D3B|nr:cold-shock protein [Rhodococcus rhodochrous]
MQGVVKWFDCGKGYGFLVPDDGSDEVFVHYSAIAGSAYRALEDNQRVEFDLGRGRIGLQAENVRAL